MKSVPQIALDVHLISLRNVETFLVRGLRSILCLVCSGSSRAARRNHFDNEETEILVIPDLEDEGEEDIVLKGKRLFLCS